MPIYRSIEMSAQQEAKRTEQKAKGELERQKLQNEKARADLTHTHTHTHTHIHTHTPTPEDEIYDIGSFQEAEMARKTLLELQAVAAAVESTGQAKAEAQVCVEARGERGTWKEEGP